MIDDFRPAPRRVKSLQENKNDLKALPNIAPATQEIEQPEPLSPAPLIPDFENFEPAPQTSNILARLKAHWPPSRRQVLLIAGVVVLLGSSTGAFLALHKPAAPVKSAPVAVKKITPPPPKPTTVASALSGLQVDPALNARPVTAVMIENSLDARPQSGLSQASVVYEAIAEGGITRFLALYQDTNPANIGPIRSVRPYYLQWAMGFDAPLAHVGGSPEALQDIKSWGARDLDQFFNSGAYHRISSRDAPHNVYSAIDTLMQASIAKGYSSSSFTSWSRKPDAAAKLATARTIDLTMSGPLYNVHYDYDATTNTYKRSEAGAAHLDANGSVQISPKVVIGLVMPYGIQSDGKHSEYGTIGSGQAYIYQDGLVTIGQWNKVDNRASMTFTDSAGQPIALNSGQTWLTAITAPTKITSAP